MAKRFERRHAGGRPAPAQDLHYPSVGKLDNLLTCCNIRAALSATAIQTVASGAGGLEQLASFAWRLFCCFGRIHRGDVLCLNIVVPGRARCTKKDDGATEQQLTWRTKKRV